MRPVCFNCAHLFRPVPGSTLLDPDEFTCTAFYPKAIPDDIMLGEFGHYEPHPEQQNREILFLSMSPPK